MSKSSRPDVLRFQHELEECRAIINKNNNSLENNPSLARQINFWMESAKFLVTELEIWDRLGKRNNYDATYNKTRKAMDYLYTLIDQLTEDD
jgi:hypothetical protein